MKPSPSRRVLAGPLLLCLAVSLAAPQAARAQAAGTTVPPGNLGLAGGGRLASDKLLIIALSESQTGADLNGDGDMLDHVPQLIELVLGTSTTLPFALSTNIVRHRQFVFVVPESEQGADLNGDGDMSDRVLHVYDRGTGQIRNIGLAQRGALQRSGKLIVLAISEDDQAATDLNGDGDALDLVVHVLDLDTGSVTNTGLAVQSLGSNTFEGDRLLVLVSENAQGNADLNGSGHVLGSVAHLFDAATGQRINTGLGSLAIARSTAGTFLLFISESVQGVDLNGNGTAALDQVLFTIDAATGASTNTGYSATGVGSLDLIPAGRWAYLPGQGSLRRLDVGAGTVTDLGVSAYGLSPFESRTSLALVSEFSGQGDLNGDGDFVDAAVLHALDHPTATVTNLGLAIVDTPDIHGNVAAALLRENGHDVRDRNGDGDVNDATLCVVRLDAGTVRYFPFATHMARSGPDHVVFTVRESSQGNTDLNGDGDLLDFVLHVLNLRTAEIKNLGAAVPLGQAFQLLGRQLLFSVAESEQGALDLNADGDIEDTIVHLITL